MHLSIVCNCISPMELYCVCTATAKYACTVVTIDFSDYRAKILIFDFETVCYHNSSFQRLP